MKSVWTFVLRAKAGGDFYEVPVEGFSSRKASCMRAFNVAIGVTPDWDRPWLIEVCHAAFTYEPVETRSS